MDKLSQWVDRELPVSWQELSLGFLGFLLLLFGAFLARRLLRAGLARVGLDQAVSLLLQQTAFYGLLVLAVITLLGTLGVQVAPLIAGLGLGGFALGFALRDMVSNLLSGILILIYRPFGVGQTISVAGKQGRVTEINLRYTVLDGADGRTVLVPNSLIFSNTVDVLKD